nr:MAG TPA: hypothetical protein [Caudoviricetes sp.]
MVHSYGNYIPPQVTKTNGRKVIKRPTLQFPCMIFHMGWGLER